MKKICIIIFAMFLFGCATFQSSQPEKPQAIKLDSKNGVLIGSFGRVPRQPYYFEYQMLLHKDDHSFSRVIDATQALLMGYKHDYSDRESEGSIFAFVLPPGNYSFYNFKIVQNDGQVYKEWSARNDFNIPFVIEPGKVTYVGEIRFVPQYVKNVFHINIPGGGDYTFIDSEKRDFPIIKKMYPNLDIDSFVVSVPEL